MRIMRPQVEQELYGLCPFGGVGRNHTRSFGRKIPPNTSIPPWYVDYGNTVILKSGF